MDRLTPGHLPAWERQTLWWSERQRSRPLLWPGEAPWFVNDPLGPLPHTHPHASEFYFVAEGVLHVTVGSTAVVLSAGDICLIPPDTFHSPRNQSGADVKMFALVSPNLKERRWKTAPFTEGDFAGTPTVASIYGNDPLPADERLAVRAVRLEPGVTWRAVNPRADVTVWVTKGAAVVSVGQLSGLIAPTFHATAMPGVPVAVSTSEGASILVFEAYGDTAASDDPADPETSVKGLGGRA